MCIAVVCMCMDDFLLLVYPPGCLIKVRTNLYMSRLYDGMLSKRYREHWNSAHSAKMCLCFAEACSTVPASLSSVHTYRSDGFSLTHPTSHVQSTPNRTTPLLSTGFARFTHLGGRELAARFCPAPVEWRSDQKKRTAVMKKSKVQGRIQDFEKGGCKILLLTLAMICYVCQCDSITCCSLWLHRDALPLL